MMDRREALARLAASGVVIGAGSSLLTSPAFADGGSVACRPTTPTTAVTWTVDAVNTTRIRMRVNPGTFAAVTCPCPTPATSIVEYRYTLDAAATPLDIFNTAGSAPISGTWFTTNDSTPVVRAPSVALPPSTSFTIRWTIRWKCNGKVGRAWRCRSWIASVTYSGAGPTATITSQSQSSPGGQCDAAPL